MSTFTLIVAAAHVAAFASIVGSVVRAVLEIVRDCSFGRGSRA